MKKIIAGSIFILLFLLSACSSGSNIDVTIEKELYFQKDKKSDFEIKVTEKDQAVEGLNIRTEFAMTNMDHGTYKVDLEEKGQGIYTSEVELPMSGEWEIVFTIERDGKTIEKVIEYEVKEPAGVATINGEWITNEDIEFYRFINELHIAINKEEAKKKYTGNELDSVLANLESQEEAIQDKNTLLTQIIRLRSMALLGLEKGHKASKEEIQVEITNVQKQYAEQEIALTMIKEYGEDKFWNKEEQQYELIILSQKVQDDLIKKVKEENPNVNKQEILYLAQKQYDELLVSQIYSLNITIL